MNLSRSTEIRHIKIFDLCNLTDVISGSWKKLMGIIPKDMSDLQYETYEKKYTSEHIRMIESASTDQNRSAFEILLEEYGTSNKIRPNLGDLMALLIKAELFRAADFVAEKFLLEQKPARPIKGPAAEIDISISSDEEDSIIKIASPTDSSHNNNKDLYDKPCQLEKDIPSMPSLSIADYPLPNLIPDMSEKSKISTGEIPNISGLLQYSERQDESCTSSSASSLVDNTMSNIQIPNFEVLNDNTNRNAECSINEIIISQSNIPMLSALNNDDLPQLSILQQGSSNLIDFSSFDINK